MFHVKWCHPEFMRGNAHERGTLRHSSPPLPSSGQTLKRAVGVSRFQIVNSKTCEIYNLKSTICNPAIFLLHNVPCEAVSSRTHARKRAGKSWSSHHSRCSPRFSCRWQPHRLQVTALTSSKKERPRRIRRTAILFRKIGV